MSADPPPARRLHLLQQIDPVDLRDSTAIGYAQALTRLYQAQHRLAAAYANGDRLARVRATRTLHAAGTEADRCLNELLASSKIPDQE